MKEAWQRSSIRHCGLISGSPKKAILLGIEYTLRQIIRGHRKSILRIPNSTGVLHHYINFMARKNQSIRMYSHHRCSSSFACSFLLSSEIITCLHAYGEMPSSSCILCWTTNSDMSVRSRSIAHRVCKKFRYSDLTFVREW